MKSDKRINVGPWRIPNIAGGIKERSNGSLEIGVKHALGKSFVAILKASSRWDKSRRGEDPIGPDVEKERFIAVV